MLAGGSTAACPKGWITIKIPPGRTVPFEQQLRGPRIWTSSSSRGEVMYYTVGEFAQIPVEAEPIDMYVTALVLSR